MKSPIILISLLISLTLASACSDDSTFSGSANSKVSVPEPVVQEPTADATDSSVTDESTTIPTSSETVDIPSLPDAQIVTKVGVNFEDRPGTDADYNDAVLCFKGGFEVSDTIIQSTEEQSVEAVLFSDAFCSNKILVNITRNGQLVSTATFDPKTEHSATLQFAKGDRLDVSMVSVDCDPGVIYPMTDKNYTQLAPDVCNVQ